MSIRTPLIALALATSVAAVAGCGSSSGAESSPASTSTGTPSTSASAPTPTKTTSSPATSSNSTAAGAPGVPEPARQHTTAGAIAFAKYYIKKVNDTYLQPKAGVLEPLALRTCKTCKNYAKSVKEMDANGQHANTRTEIPRSAQRYTGEDGMVIEVKYDQPEVKILDSAGQTVQTVPATKNAGLVFFLDWTSAGWQVSEIESEPAASTK